MRRVSASWLATTSAAIAAAILVAAIFVLAARAATAGKFFRLDSDYDANLPILSYVVSSVRRFHALPKWNPYVGKGIPVLADPLSSVGNPLMIVPIVLLGVEEGLWMVFFLVITVSGISMWFLLTRIGVRGWPRWWGMIMYQIAGTVSAQVASGHVHQLLAYPVIPLILYGAIQSKSRMWVTIGLAFVLSYLVYSGEWYSLWFSGMFLVWGKIYAIVGRKQSVANVLVHGVATIIFLTLLTAPKLSPLVIDVWPQMVRFFPIDPFAGSLHLIFSPLPFLIPFREAFYDRPILQRTLGFHYNWYEYFAFISPLPFFFFLRVGDAMKREYARILLLLIVVGVLYVSLGYPYSPFHWLVKAVPALGTFRVPQRMYLVLTSVVVALLALTVSTWMRRESKAKTRRVLIVMAIGSLVWTGLVSHRAFVSGFELPRTEERALVTALRDSDEGSFFVAAFTCCVQWFLVQEGIPVLNYYYGWRSTMTPNFLNDAGTGLDYSVLESVRPTYVIATRTDDLSGYSYVPYLRSNRFTVWSSSEPTVTPNL